MHVASSVIIGIEEVSVLWNFCAISRDEFFQDKRFEKPSGMREVPFGRTNVRHGLHDAIFRFEISTQRVGEFSDLMKAIAQAHDPGFARGENRSIRRRRLEAVSTEGGLKDFLLLGRFLPGALRAFDRELLLRCLQSRDALRQFPLPECRDVGCDAPWNWR